MVNWCAHAKHILPFNSNNKAPIHEGKGAWASSRVRRISMMGKARRRAAAYQ